MNKIFEIIKRSGNKDIFIDITYKETLLNKKIVIFCHGFKGFKDWGCFNLVADSFADNDFVFIKFNFSHNGTNSTDMLNFVDLDAFGNNNFSKELDDLGCVIDWVFNSNMFNNLDITLIGHSRGGGISMLKTREDDRIDKVITWASPSNFMKSIDQDKVNIWKEKGVAYVYNSRTQQNMPIFIQFYQDCIENSSRINIQKAVSNIRIPQLIIHGDKDPTVSLDQALDLKKWNKTSELYIVKDADHVFGATHPYKGKLLPKHFNDIINRSISFINL